MGLKMCPSFKPTMLTSKNHRLSVTVTSWKCLYLGKLMRYWFELNRYMLERWYSTEFKKNLNFAKFCSKTHFCLAWPIWWCDSSYLRWLWRYSNGREVDARGRKAGQGEESGVWGGKQGLRTPCVPPHYLWCQILNLEQFLGRPLLPNLLFRDLCRMSIYLKQVN